MNPYLSTPDLNQTDQEKLSIILAAIGTGGAIQFDYRDVVGKLTTDRIVDPNLTKATKSEGVRVIGTCRLRNAECREFRLDGMTNVRAYSGMTVEVGNLLYNGKDIFIVARTAPYQIVLINVVTGRRFYNVLSTTSMDKYLLKNLIDGEPTGWQVLECNRVDFIHPNNQCKNLSYRR